MVANPTKFQVIFPGSDNSSLGLLIDHKYIPSSHCVTLLGIKIDSKLTFSEHITNMCQKANNKTKALLRIRNYLNLNQASLLCNSFILTYFNYCPIIWMFSNKTNNNKIQKTYIRSLRSLLNNFNATSEEILSLSKRKTIHKINLQKLAIEVYKCLNKISPSMISELFSIKENQYNLRRSNLLSLPLNKDPNFWVFRAVLLWNNLDDDIKFKKTLSQFKNSLQNINLYCQCKICL